jgi:hypothetical protein
MKTWFFALLLAVISTSAFAKQECSVNWTEAALPVHIKNNGVAVDIETEGGARLVRISDATSGFAMNSTVAENQVQTLDITVPNKGEINIQCFENADTKQK